MSKKPKKEKKEEKTKICPGCQAEIPKKAKVCPNCAAKQKKGSPLPLALALAALLLVAAAVSVFVFHFPIDPPFELPFLNGGSPKSIVGETMGLSRKQEEAVLAVFTECGFENITEVKPLSVNSEGSSYSIDDIQTARFMETEDDIVVLIDGEAKTVDSITYMDHDIYRGGQVVEPVTELYLNLPMRDQYLSSTLAAVKARLDIPETAVFPSRSNWKYTTDGDKVTVQSSVTYKNASGQEETKDFLVEYENGDFVSFQFLEEPDGESSLQN